MALVQNIKKSIGDIGQIELSGIKLESAEAKLLDVGSLDLDRHVAMQPAAIAYYGSMLKEAERNLAMLKRSKDRWEKKQWALAKAAVLSGTTAQWKPTLADIEARFITDNEMELEAKEKVIDRAQDDADTLSSWYEAWRQKSFALQQHVKIDSDETWNSSGSMMEKGEQGGNEKIREVRELMRRRRGWSSPSGQ